MGYPPTLAEAAFIGPTTNIVSRVEIYESDGSTRWRNGDLDDRLIDGSITVDYSRTERRAFELELDNSDFALEHSPGEFWYDKILKIFTGVEYDDFEITTSYVYNKNLCTNPQAANASTSYSVNYGGGSGSAARITTAGSPIGNTAYEMTWSTAPNTTSAGVYWIHPTGTFLVDDTKKYSCRAFGRATGYTPQVRFIVFFYDESGLLQATDNDVQVLPDGQWVSLVAENLTPPAGTTRILVGVYHNNTSSGVGSGDKLAITGVVIEEGETCRRFFDGETLDFGNRQYYWDGTANASTSTEQIEVTSEVPVHQTWDTQLGEFLIDSIAESHFPYTMKVTGRDQTKKCLTSKFTVATAYASGTAIETAIQAIASAAGVSKFLFPITGHSLGKDYAFERGNTRWDAMNQIAASFGYDLYFDTDGYLVLQEQQDPVTAPLSHTLSTGSYGNLVGYEKKTTDTRIYNNVVVTGESQDINVPPVYAVATNTEPSSPTNIEKLGDRVYQYTSSFIVSTAQAQDVADKFLKLHSLEQFDLNFSSISAPWLDVGTIVEFDDPRPAAGQPTRFLLDSLTIPLGLDAMSGTAKRVTVVG